LFVYSTVRWANSEASFAGMRNHLDQTGTQISIIDDMGVKRYLQLDVGAD